jgi:ribosomal protein L40E
VQHGPPPPVPAKSGPVNGTVCRKCKTVNPPAMNYCRTCGNALATQPAAPSKVASGSDSSSRMPSAADVVGHTSGKSVTPAPRKIRCRTCNAETPRGFKFCQQCGQPLNPDELAQAATDPADTARPPRQRDSRPPGVPTGLSSKGLMVPDAVATTLAANSPDARRLIDTATEIARRRTIEEDPAVQSTLPETPMEQIGHTPSGPVSAVTESGRLAVAIGAGPTWGSLVTVRQDGSDGRVHGLSVDVLEIGRGSGGLSFDDDRYLAPLHARIERSAGVVTIVPIDTVNGVFRRLSAQTRLGSGDVLLLGRELMRFDLVDEDERVVKALVQGGVVRFGSPQREPWGRLSFLLPNSGIRDVRYLHGAEIAVGREDGDILFRDDEFLSRRHAALRFVGGRCTVEDLNSSNGTYLRLHEPTKLEHRDYLRLGNQLFRFELGG